MPPHPHDTTSVSQLLGKIRAYAPRADLLKIQSAYSFAEKKHATQKRADGTPYITHPLAVAGICADLKLDDGAIITALLHDTLEDTETSFKEIADTFGHDIAQLVEGVTKLTKIKFSSKQKAQVENFRKLLLAMSQDIRVLMVKLADRLHNMRTLGNLPTHKRQRIAQETLDLYVPLADRIGLHSLKNTLQDLAFRELQPLVYDRIDARMSEWRAQENLVDRVITDLKRVLKGAKIEADVTGREKSVYSIHAKMQRKGLAFDQLTDIFAYRIMVATRRDCYNVLGLMHDEYRAIPGRFKDYISAPKPNGYQSLHTSVIGPFGNRMEVQIRTQKMHDIAELGVAAHMVYKDVSAQQTGFLSRMAENVSYYSGMGQNGRKGTGQPSAKASDAQLSDNQRYAWLRQLVEHLQGMEDPEEFYENAKLELFDENVFVFTPEGDLMTLPRGSTPLDFAFHVHTDVGMRTNGARVNGRVVPLRTRLKNGDMVEIITSKSQNPSPHWRSFVVSARAKNAISRHVRAQESEEQTRLGKAMLEKAARRYQLAIPSEKQLLVYIKEEQLDQVDSVENLYRALGQGRLFPKAVLDGTTAPPPEKSDTKTARDDDIALPDVSSKSENKTKEALVDDEIGISGLTPGMAIHLAKCCNPLPGERIIGVITTGKGVSVHRRKCKNLEQFNDEPERFLPIRWTAEAEDIQTRYTAHLRLTLLHEKGALATVASAFANADANIVDMHVERRGTDMYTMRADVEVGNKEHLRRTSAMLQALKVVHHVERV